MATAEENVRTLAHGIHQLNVNSPDPEVVDRVQDSISELAGGSGGGGGGVTLTEIPERPGVFQIGRA